VEGARGIYSAVSFLQKYSKQIDGRNSVKTGNSCAAVTGYDFPIANLGLASGEGGKKDGPQKP
jgi:hypothetical protein